MIKRVSCVFPLRNPSTLFREADGGSLHRDGMISAVANIYDHADYRSWLKEWFRERKSLDNRVSYRQWGARIGVDPGYLSHVLQGKEHLADAVIPAVAKEARLDRAQTAFLLDLVAYNKARSPKEIAERFARLAESRSFRVGVLAESQSSFFVGWHHMAVRLALSLQAFDGDWERLGRRLIPPIPARKAEESARLMENLGMIRRTDAGTYELDERFVSTGDAWTAEAIRDYQLQSLQRAADAMVTLPKEERDISTASLTLPASEMPLLQERVRAFRQSLLRWSAGFAECDTAYQVNIQIFPIAKSDPSPTGGEAT